MVDVSGAGNARMTASDEPDGVSIILEGELDIASVS